MDRGRCVAWLVAVWLLLAWCPVRGAAWAATPDGIPPGLEAWKDFVLHGDERALCPPDGNDTGRRLCLFPSSLDLDVDATGASFTLRVRVMHDRPVVVPHGEGAFLERASLDGQPAAVVRRDGGPVIWLGPGQHVIEGRLGWRTMPAALSLPPDAGAVALRRDNAAWPVVLGPDGALRLGVGDRARQAANTERVTILRRVRDGVPVTVTTLVRLDVAGLARSITLPGIVPGGALPLAVRSPVPAAFGPDGALVLDAGPGRYEVEVTARFPGRIDKLGPAVCAFGPEVWSFEEAPAVRTVALDGMTSLDPQTVDVPAGWKHFPAVRAQKGETLTLRELGRGAATGRDALRLERQLWLDFSGQGLSVLDRVTGENREAWTLSMLAPGALGRVTVADRDQPVVRLGKNGAAGVELRQSPLRLTARSRYPDASAAIPAGGFDRLFERVEASLALPPGWGLVAALGPDTVSGGLLSGWTLLDVFLAALTTVAAFSLAGVRVGVVLGLFLTLSWREPGAPTLSWLFVVAGMALVRLAGDAGRLAGHPGWQRLVRWFFAGSLLGVMLVAVPFASRQLRQAVAPQLGGVATMDLLREPEVASEISDAVSAQIHPTIAPAPAKRKAAAPKAPAAVGSPLAAENFMELDPGSLVQTGPATPAWYFRTVSFSWNGPVATGQTLRLILLPPWAGRCLDVARVILLGLALLWCGGAWRAGRLPRPIVVGLLVLLAVAAWERPALAGDFPSKELLEAFHGRLVEPAACFPNCLGSSSMAVRLEEGRLRVDVGLDAAAPTAAPLPAVGQGWRPARVLLDGAPASSLVRSGDSLKVLVGPGRHAVTLEGPAPEAVSLTIAPVVAPDRVTVTAPGYSVRGLDALGRLRGVLELVRSQSGAGTSSSTASGPVIPPFFQVSRDVAFGLTFTVTTSVTRRSPASGPALAAVPLLAGETPDVADVTVRDGMAEVAFAPGQTRVSWRSRLPSADRLVLEAPDGGQLVETWKVVAAPFYDVTYDGPPPVSHLDPAGMLAPRFEPWPGERLVIGLTRPKAAPGRFLTLEQARLVTHQGERARETSLRLTVRSARGERHAVTLPAGAEVTRLVVGGRETAVTGGPGKAGFSLPPGVTEVRLDFREAVPLGMVTRTPRLDLGLPVANLQVELELPEGRWLLGVTGDTPLGPAVLYWGWLAFVLAAGLGLATLERTPLSRWQWCCYALGLSQATPWGFVLAVAWLLALGSRRRQAMPDSPLAFNAVQILLVVLALAGCGALYVTLENGLLGLPRMQVSGNGATATDLVWTFDRGDGTLPACSAISLPLVVFRLGMLAWAIWLAWAFVGWLRWGFVCLTEGGGWRRLQWRLTLPGLGSRRRPASSGDGARKEDKA